MSIKIEFVHRDNGPERLLCEAEIHFLDGELEGLKFVGFSLWKAPAGDVYVTFPSRAFGVGGERRYFDYIRSIDGDHNQTKKLKVLILEAYKTWTAKPEEVKA